jgi:hypothetical protein
MKTSTSTKARSMVFGTLVVLAIATSVVSALYVSGIVGTRQIQQQTSTTSSQSAPAIAGGYLLARNATATFCTLSSTTNATESNTANSTTITSSNTDCLPIGYR